MRNFFALAATVCATASALATYQEDKDDFPKFEQLMQSAGAGYSWEAIEVETDDGYELTLFHITGDENGDPVDNAGSAGPTLFVHGFSGNAMKWLGRSDETLDAMPVQLYKQGHDVYIPSTRGSTYSEGHTEFAFDSAEYWDFAREEIALNDLPALVDAVQLHSQDAASGCKKVKIVSISAGGEQTFRMLAKKEGIESQVQSAFVIAPAFSASKILLLIMKTIATPEKLGTLVNSLRSQGVYSLFGANWDAQREAMCQVEYGDGELDLCAAQRQINKVRFGSSPISLKLFEAFAQSAMTYKWQNYIDTDTFAEGGDSRFTDLVDVEQIDPSIAITTFVGTKDIVISNDVINVVMQPLIERGQATVMSDSRDHMMADDNDAEFVNAIIEGLGVSNFADQCPGDSTTSGTEEDGDDDDDDDSEDDTAATGTEGDTADE